MGIYEDIEDLKKKTTEETDGTEEEHGDDENDDNDESESVDDAESNEDEEDNGSGNDDDDSDEEAAEENALEEKPDNAAMARMRREKAALERQLEELKKSKQEPEKKEESAEKDEDPEPDPDDVEDHLRWQNRQLKKEVDDVKTWRNEFVQKNEEQETVSRAINNFKRIESDFKKSVDDYDDASEHMVNKMLDGVRAIYPNASDEEVGSFVYNQILQMANGFAAQKLNPAEELYHMAKERYGFTGKQEETKEDVKPKLRQVADNKKKSVNSLGGSGSRKAEKNIKDLSVGELSKLSPAERAELVAKAQTA